MIVRYRNISRAFLVVLWLSTCSVAVQAEHPSLHQLANSTTPTPAAQPPSQSAAPQVDTAEIIRRTNQEVGFDIQATISDWKRELDHVESVLRRPSLRYAELNELRDELQHVRSRVEGFQNALQPMLNSAKSELDLRGPAPAAGQTQEPEQVALARAELSYRVGLLSEGQAAVKSAQVRIDQLANAIQDTRRKNFTTRLFQRIPGVYSYETWAELPEAVPLATNQISGLIADWWKNVRDHDEIVHTAFEAGILWAVLTFAGWQGVRRLRVWRGAGEPPFWSRASSAAGIVLLRTLPLVIPIIFLYVAVAEGQNIPDALGWLFYSAAQSAIIIFTVNALVTTVFAPKVPVGGLSRLPITPPHVYAV